MGYYFVVAIIKKTGRIQNIAHENILSISLIPDPHWHLPVKHTLVNNDESLGLFPKDRLYLPLHSAPLPVLPLPVALAPSMKNLIQIPGLFSHNPTSSIPPPLLPSLSDSHVLWEGKSHTTLPVPVSLQQPMGATLCVSVLVLPHPTRQLLVWGWDLT